MSTNEKDRLDLRQAFEVVFANERIARIAMEAMPPIDYSALATKRDVEVSGIELRGEFAELRGEFAELRGEFAELRGEVNLAMSRNLWVIVGAQVATMLMLGGYITAVG